MCTVDKPLLKTEELLSVYLFQLINKFCNQNVIVLPIKKIILFLWKVLLFTLGGLDKAFKSKNEQRAKFDLPIIVENPAQVINQMSPATPPPNPIDLVNDLQLANPNSSYKRKKVSTIRIFCIFFRRNKNWITAKTAKLIQLPFKNHLTKSFIFDENIRNVRFYSGKVL